MTIHLKHFPLKSIPTRLKPCSILLSNPEKVSVLPHSICSMTLERPFVPILCERSGDCSAGLAVTVTAYLIYATSIYLPSRALLWQFHPLIHFQLLLIPLSSIFRALLAGRCLICLSSILQTHLGLLFSRGSTLQT